MDHDTANLFAEQPLATTRMRLIDTPPRTPARAVQAALEPDSFSAMESALLLGAFFSLLVSGIAFTLI
jgi:hypothetical protein